MAPTLPDDAAEWAANWRDRVNDRPDFERAAADLSVTLRFRIEPDDGFAGDPVVVQLVVDDGVCTVATTDPDEPADVTVAGGYEAWKRLLRDEIDVASALSDGQFAADGDRLLLLRHRAAVAELVQAARDVEARFAT